MWVGLAWALECPASSFFLPPEAGSGWGGLRKSRIASEVEYLRSQNTNMRKLEERFANVSKEADMLRAQLVKQEHNIDRYTHQTESFYQSAAQGERGSSHARMDRPDVFPPSRTKQTIIESD